MKGLRELFRYRELLKNLVTTELKLRYRRSLLGFIWTMLNPLLMMVVLSIVFSTVLRFDLKNYSVFLLAALLPWTFFSQSISLSLMSIVSKGALLHKVYFPKAVIPMAAVLSNLLNFLLALVPLVLIMLVTGTDFSLALLYVPAALVALALFTTGLALIFSVLNVFFRDFTHMTEVLLTLWFYLSPVIYPVDMVPERYRGILNANPLRYFFEGFREPIYFGRLPALGSVVIAFASGIGMLTLGWLVFRSRENALVFRV